MRLNSPLSSERSQRTRIVPILVGLAKTWGVVAPAMTDTTAAPLPPAWPMVVTDAVKLDLVLQLVVACSGPEKLGGTERCKDGKMNAVASHRNSRADRGI